MANAKKVFDAVAVIGEYTNKNGDTKKNYLNIGSVFENDKGALSLKLNAVPLNFNGWISFYVPKEKESAGDSKPKIDSKEPFEDFDSNIPF